MGEPPGILASRYSVTRSAYRVDYNDPEFRQVVGDCPGNVE